MRSSSRHIIKNEETENIVVKYEPTKFPVKIPEPAKSFVRFETGPVTSFKISDLVSQQTGITIQEQKNLENKVQDMVLAQLKEVEEKAYKEAYELGLDVGRKEAFDHHIAQYKEQFNKFGETLQLIQELTQKLIVTNEARLVDLVFKVAEKIAMDHIKGNREVILKVLVDVFADLQKDEKVLVKVSPGDYEFIEEVKARLGYNEELKILENQKIEVSDDIKDGGCLIETNYGVVDATVAERLNKLWIELEDKIPKIEDKVRNES